jgi:hypothetical protein
VQVYVIICDFGVPSNHVCIKFWFKMDKNSTETFKMLEVGFEEQWEEHRFFNGFSSSKAV